MHRNGIRTRTRHTCKQSHGSVLVCVLVVLLVSGMLAMLGLRLVVATHNSQQQRAKILQAQELVQLGRMVLTRQADPSKKPTDKPLSTIELSIAPRPGADRWPALITLEPLTGDGAKQWRIVARYPYNLPGEVQATWQGTLGR